MVLSQLFRSPFVRLPFLGFAVVATVATTAPDGWFLDDSTPVESIELARGASVERTIAYEASERSVQLTVDLGATSTTTGKLRVVAASCGIDESVEQREPQRWRSIDGSGSASPSWTVTPRLLGWCSGATGTVTVRIENLGADPIVVHATMTVTISGPGNDSLPPKDAFIHVRLVP